MKHKVRFRIDLPAEAFLRYYRGSARAVIVQADDNRRYQLPAGRLQPFLLKEGIYGDFEMVVDNSNRLIDIFRIKA